MPKHVPYEHIVMVNYRGNPVDPTEKPVLGIGHYTEVGEVKFGQQLGEVLTHVDEYARVFKPGAPSVPHTSVKHEGRRVGTHVGQSLERALARQRAATAEALARGEPPPDQRWPNPRVMIFIHGGLNTQAGSVERAVKLHEPVLADGVFPLFVNWQSSLFSSYWDHLFLVRYGEEAPTLAWISAPFVVLEDLFRAIGRSPMTLYNELDNAQNSSSLITSDNQKRGRALALDAQDARLPVEFPEAESQTASDVATFALDIALAVPHMVLGILIDIGGTASWEQMRRRTDMILESEESYRSRSVGLPAPAAVPRLFKELRQLQRRLHADGIELEVDLIAHSMGCIISNLLLGAPRGEAYGPDAEGMPVFTNIVFMANADTIENTERAVYGHLSAAGHGRTKFFSLSLNDRAEFAETTAFYLAPKGSLLVWIDRFFEATPSMNSQRGGKLLNQLFSLHRIPKELRERVQFKSFRFKRGHPKTNPVVHGDFNDGKFWRPEYFTPRPKSPVMDR